MSRVGFKVASSLLAALVCSAGIAGAAEVIQLPEEAGAAAGLPAAPAAAGNADAVGPQPQAAKPEVAGPAAKKTHAKKAAVKKRRARKARKAKRAAEAKKQAAAKKAAAAKRASAAKKSVAAPKGSGAGKAAALPAGAVQSARIAAAGSAVIGAKMMVECRLQRSLPAAVAERNSKVVLTDSPKGKVLTLKIVDVEARSGGFLSGRKGMTVEGRLIDGGKTKGTFTAKESSMGAVDSCGMLQKAIGELAAEIGAWVDRPEMNSKLGDAR